MSATDNWNHGWPQAADDYQATRTSTGVVLLRPNVKAETSELTEDALALRFSERHADDLRYIATKGTWLKWDGARWYPEATHMAFDLARQSCRADAQAYGNGRAPNSVYSAKTIAAVERMAKADRRQASTIEEWDADKSAFNTRED
jgi:putative DNA primase/helicase